MENLSAFQRSSKWLFFLPMPMSPGQLIRLRKCLSTMSTEGAVQIPREEKKYCGGASASSNTGIRLKARAPCCWDRVWFILTTTGLYCTKPPASTASGFMTGTKHSLLILRAISASRKEAVWSSCLTYSSNLVPRSKAPLITPTARSSSGSSVRELLDPEPLRPASSIDLTNLSISVTTRRNLGLSNSDVAPRSVNNANH